MELIEARGGIAQIPDLLQNLGCSRPLLVTGNRSFAAAEELLSAWMAKVGAVRYLKAGENVQQREIEEAFEVLLEEGCDGVVGIGGGSVMDLAGPVAAGAAEATGMADFLTCSREFPKRALPLIYVPTTAGSGSEATRYAVTYRGKDKLTLTSNSLLPDVAILDPDMTASLSPRQTAISGIDAIAQAMESWWAVEASEFSISYSNDALTQLVPAIRKAVRGDSDARAAMLKGSYLAGCAINVTKTTVPHAFSYALTSHFGIPHGHAVSFWLPRVLRYNAAVSAVDCNDSRGYDDVQARLKAMSAVLANGEPEAGVKALVALMKDLDLALYLDEMGVDEEKLLGLLTKTVNPDRLGNNPRALTDFAALLHILDDLR